MKSWRLFLCFVGSFVVDTCINKVTYRLKLHSIMRVHPIVNESQLKPVSFSSFTLDPPPPPPPRLVDGFPAYWVSHILTSCRVQYLLDWKGYGPEERFCVPEHSVSCNKSLMFHPLTSPSFAKFVDMRSAVCPSLILFVCLLSCIVLFLGSEVSCNTLSIFLMSLTLYIWGHPLTYSSLF